MEVPVGRYANSASGPIVDSKGFVESERDDTPDCDRLRVLLRVYAGIKSSGNDEEDEGGLGTSG